MGYATLLEQMSTDIIIPTVFEPKPLSGLCTFLSLIRLTVRQGMLNLKLFLWSTCLERQEFTDKT